MRSRCRGLTVVATQQGAHIRSSMVDPANQLEPLLHRDGRSHTRRSQYHTEIISLSKSPVQAVQLAARRYDSEGSEMQITQHVTRRSVGLGAGYLHLLAAKLFQRLCSGISRTIQAHIQSHIPGDRWSHQRGTGSVRLQHANNR